MSLKNFEIGIDEVGRGCLAGPVAACAFCFNPKFKADPMILKFANDSKKMTAKNREKLFKIFITEAAQKKVFFGIGLVSSQIIDQINIRQATKLAMERALEELSLKIDFEKIKSVLVDGKDNFEFEILKKKPIFIIDGDQKVLEIKAASIMAKVFRDNLMKYYAELYPEFSFEKHKGYGTKKHLEAVNLHGLNGIHRKTFKPLNGIANKKKLLIHICCGPDACIPFKDLKKEYEITAFWYDPNIHPKSEYLKRLRAFKKVCKLEKIDFIEGEYDTESYFKIAKGLEKEPEKGKRCEKCYDLRLKRSAVEAKKINCNAFTTVLTMSPRKDFKKIESIGNKQAQLYSIPFLAFDFKKGNGYLRSIEYCKENKIYRQNYCGCVYSSDALR